MTTNAARAPRRDRRQLLATDSPRHHGAVLARSALERVRHLVARTIPSASIARQAAGCRLQAAGCGLQATG